MHFSLCQIKSIQFAMHVHNHILVFEYDKGLCLDFEIEYIHTEGDSLHIDDFKIIGTSSNKVYIWDVDTGELRLTLIFDSLIRSMTVVDGKLLVHTNNNLSLLCFDKMDMDEYMQVVIVNPGEPPKSELVQKRKLIDLITTMFPVFETRNFRYEKNIRIYAIYKPGSIG